MPRGLGLRLAAVILLGTLLGGGTVGAADTLASSQPLTGSILSAEPISVEGTLQTDPAPAIAHARTSQTAALEGTLTAETLEVTYTWRSGERARASSDGDDIVRASHDEGQETRSFDAASVDISGLQAEPEVLVYNVGSSDLQARGEGLVELAPIVDRTLSEVENSNETTSLGDTPEHHGFHYRIEDPAVSVDLADAITVEGSFDLFVNNVTLDVSASEENWDHWTGYREQSMGPASKFESRVTRISVENATLSLRAPDSIQAIAEEHSGRISGHVVADQAQGRISQAATDYTFDGERVGLEGSGAFDTSVAPDSTTDLTEPLDDSGQLPVRFSPEGPFTVDEKTLSVASQSHEGAATGFIAGSWWIPASFLALTVVVAAGRRPVGAKIDAWRAELRDRRVTSWMRTGDRLTSVREFDRALKWYDRITETYPNHAEAWYSKGACLAEVDDHVGAARAYAEANELIGGDDPQLLDLAAAEAWEAGEEELAIGWFGRLAELEPRRFLQRLDQPGYGDLREREQIRVFLDELDPDTSPSVA